MDIDFPLLETTRPPMYTFDKYVGKKPHNIWASYIEAYTKKNGIVLGYTDKCILCNINFGN